MLIANPLYDTVFKYLMEDKEVAKRIIGILIGADILDIAFKATEHAYPASKERPLTLFRMDFLAKIATPQGPRKVLIEVQKARRPTDLNRFRNYLGQQYALPEEPPLPIITIYFLGYKLDGMPEAVTKVSRRLEGVPSGKLYTDSHEFVDSLTHDCYIVQVRRLRKRLQTPIEKVLSIFDQSYQIKGGKPYFLNYPEEVDDELLRRILRRLHKITADEALRKTVEDEEEAEREYEAVMRLLKQQEANAVLARQRKEEARQRVEEAIRLLLEMGLSAEEIARRLQIDVEQVKRLS
jgi:hypothetical protein